MVEHVNWRSDPMVRAGLSLMSFLAMGLASAALAASPAAMDKPAASADSVGEVSADEHGLTRSYRLSWGVRAIGADKLHKLGLTGKGVTVAVIDSGLGKDVAGLQRNISNASIDIVPRRKTAR